jgi:sugar lactone lactonase YvrE
MNKMGDAKTRSLHHQHLWVTAPDKASVMMLQASQLVPGGTAAPAVAVWGSTPGASALAFDAAGNLWVGRGTEIGSSLLEFTPDQLAATEEPLTVTQPEPTVKLRGPGTSLHIPSGVAFDANGSLWVANQGGNAILKFTASQLGNSGDPAPRVVIETTSAPAVLAFHPHPANLPLR